MKPEAGHSLGDDFAGSERMEGKYMCCYFDVYIYIYFRQNMSLRVLKSKEPDKEVQPGVPWGRNLPSMENFFNLLRFFLRN